MSSSQIQRAQEKVRKQKVDRYKEYITNMEEDYALFYKNQLEREKISEMEYAVSLKERSLRYEKYSKDVLKISYMTNAEKLALSREYQQKSEAALTDHIKLVKELGREEIEERKKAEREKLEDAMENSTDYVSDRNYYSNWQDFGDNPLQAFSRVDKRLSEAVLAGTMSYEEYYDKLSSFGSAMYEDRINNSNRWLSHEREMNRISSEDYIAGLYRMREYTEEYYSAGIISHRQYIDGMQSLEERIFNERKAQHQEILRQAEAEKDAVDETAQAKIDALEKQYKAAIADMDEDNRDEELSYLKAQERIYANAATKEGKDRLSEIREDIEKIKEEERRIALKENLDASKERVLSAAERKKASIDREASRAAYDLGLYYDEDTGYRMISNANSALSSVLSEQESFSQKSYAQIDSFNSELNAKMTESFKTVATGILTNFQSFAQGLEAIKNQIFSDVAAVNSLDFSAFGTSGKAIRTSITYNDYGDKNISGTAGSFSIADTLSSLIAKGGRI